MYKAVYGRAVRFRLANTRLGALFDSLDICQSVLASFFVRTAAGQYDIDSPDQLLGLLMAMARNKLAFQARKQRAQCRDRRRVAFGDPRDLNVAAPDPTPCQHVSAQELLQEAQRRLTAVERQIVELRQEGVEWAAIAERLGGSPEALRKKLTRALDRIALELGLDEP